MGAGVQTKDWAKFRKLRGQALAAALAVSALLAGCRTKEEAPQPGPPDVEFTEVAQRDVPVYEEWVAQLNGRNNAQITPRVQGYLLSQNYIDGFFVKKGQLLYTIDPRSFQTAVEQAEAQVAVAVANLSGADTNVARDKPLAAQSAIPQKQLDTDLATQAASQAQLDAAKAQLAQAQLNLSWTKVYSPIDGIAGLSTAQIGNLVGTSTIMTTVSQVNPIWAYFSISETQYLAHAAMISKIIRGKQVSTVPIEFIQANGVPYPSKGRMILVAREVGTQTGTIQLAAQFPNESGMLRPGGFGRVRFQTSSNPGALLVPQEAVIQVQSIYTVAVIGPNNKAAFRVVTVGDQVGTDWIITSGLKPGDKVIVKGFMKLREGTPVNPKPYVATPAESN